MFSRVGIPKEILTDQGTNFMSNLMSELFKLLGVKHLRTSPYHSQTDGMLERFHGTLKAMLRKCKDVKKEWDTQVPFLLYAYREAIHATTGFSPFELVYARHTRGPLDVLKEQWLAGKKTPESIVQYVLDMRQTMADMTQLAGEREKANKSSMKTWYDKKARDRTFCEGDQVLVLMTNGQSKLDAQ